MLSTKHLMLAALFASSTLASAVSHNQEVLKPESVARVTNINTYRDCWETTREACRADYQDCGDALCSNVCLDYYPGIANCCTSAALNGDQVRDCLSHYVPKPVETGDSKISTKVSMAGRTTSLRANTTKLSRVNSKNSAPLTSTNPTKPNGESRLTAIGSGKLALAGIIINSALWMYLL
ncbi:uncharacterized protein K489DRAFT_373686 [Dissoconium aciculare CBS 342.82]|uniref:Extracellular membrane protein CFEM domain-containing protein n=1 Tax=Dissoconium aciculare CBS 342.82 TaxID=1314786 RepID=A0A6J3LX72_9PEZI|nr:uncharacterized protein K489DRAFT_373686 [Dissoconium aciculare CBS 342.82]KAF1819237.1 hypothetical protein K489DRAFT_373686 [Dissoconium aciculare CBS 342.82]